MSEDKAPRLNRRAVFAGAGAAGALAGAAALVPLATTVEPQGAAPADADASRQGYQLTQHVLRYYQTARV